MKFSSLGSGSSGNSSYIEMGNKKFLIDAGFSGKKIMEKLNNIERKILKMLENLSFQKNH